MFSCCITSRSGSSTDTGIRIVTAYCFHRHSTLCSSSYSILLFFSHCPNLPHAFYHQYCHCFHLHCSEIWCKSHVEQHSPSKFSVSDAEKLFYACMISKITPSKKVIDLKCIYFTLSIVRAQNTFLNINKKYV